MSNVAPLKLGIIGAGRIGSVHAANAAANPNIELVAIVDPFIENAEKLAGQHGAVALADAEEALASGRFEAVIIGSPTPTHVPLLRLAAKHNIAALCEKPIDLDIEAARSCIEELADSTTPLMLGFNRRFDTHFANAHARVQAGEIGKLEQLIIISRDPAPAPRGYLEQSGGIFRDMSIHDLDMARFFVPNIVAVHATTANAFSTDIAELGDADSVTITLKGANGEIVTIINSRHCAFGYDQRLEVFGATAQLNVANPLENTVTVARAGATQVAPAAQEFFLERYKDAYHIELAAFVEFARGKDVTVPTLRDGLAALELAEACVASAKTGAAVQL